MDSPGVLFLKGFDMSNIPLQIYSDDDGVPWMAFVVGDADPVAVAAAITPTAIEEETGFADAHLRNGEVSWPPNIKHYWLRPASSDDDAEVQVCKEGDADAYLVTGHRFYPQN